MLHALFHPRTSRVEKEVHKAVVSRDPGKAYACVAKYVTGSEDRMLRRATKLFDLAVSQPNPIEREFFIEQGLVPVLRERSALYQSAERLRAPLNAERMLAEATLSRIGRTMPEMPRDDRLARLEDQVEALMHQACLEPRVRLAYAKSMSPKLLADLEQLESTPAGSALLDRLPRVMLQFENIAQDVLHRGRQLQPLAADEQAKAAKFIAMARAYSPRADKLAGLNRQQSELLLGHMARFFDEAEIDGITTFLRSKSGREYIAAVQRNNPQIERSCGQPWLRQRVVELQKKAKPVSEADAGTFGASYIDGLNRRLEQGRQPVASPAVANPAADPLIDSVPL